MCHVFQNWMDEIWGAIYIAACLFWHRWWKSRCFITSCLLSYSPWHVLCKDEWTASIPSCMHLNTHTYRQHDNPHHPCIWEALHRRLSSIKVRSLLLLSIECLWNKSRNHHSPEYVRHKEDVSLFETFNDIKTFKMVILILWKFFDFQCQSSLTPCSHSLQNIA